MLTVAFVVSTSGQRRVRSVQSGTVYRPVAVRRVYWRNPFYPRFYDPFYDPYFYDPYLRERRERYYREQSLRSKERELRKHREKYGRDGVITAKEQRELDDDIRDVQKARAKLAEHRRDYYGRNY
jgi:hypothetical protein